MARPMPAHPGYGPAPSSEQVDWLLDRDMAFHLISVHADPIAVCRSEEENREQHHREHTGPGTVRGHPEAFRGWQESKIELVLEEIEE
jgi:hypothetical protein